MSNFVVKIKAVSKLTHDIVRIVAERPPKFTFRSGQATEISINKGKWKKEKRPFTFTCLPEDDFLEFMIKTYPEHKGVTDQLLGLEIGDELILHDVFGAIDYKGEGVFIAGGAGATPFIAILRHLQAQSLIGDNIMIFANKTQADILIEQELKNMLGLNLINILSEERAEGCAFGLVTAEFIKANVSDLNQVFYICGPPPMIKGVEAELAALKVSAKSIVKEEF